MENYYINYECGCIHQLIENDVTKNEAFHKPTGNNTDCAEHKTQ